MYTQTPNNSRILGIDPGYERLGVAVIEKKNGRDSLLFSDCVTTPKTDSHELRLKAIGEAIENIIDTYNPLSVGIEKLFFNVNQKTALLVSEARGVVLYECARKGLRVCEYTPLEIKVAVTGYGRADKNHVIKMVEKLIALPPFRRHDDEYDAIAAALTCSASERSIRR